MGEREIQKERERERKGEQGGRIKWKHLYRTLSFEWHENVYACANT